MLYDKGQGLNRARGCNIRPHLLPSIYSMRLLFSPDFYLTGLPFLDDTHAFLDSVFSIRPWLSSEFHFYATLTFF